jgi:hypothetical protein
MTQRTVTPEIGAPTHVNKKLRLLAIGVIPKLRARGIVGEIADDCGLRRKCENPENNLLTTP